MNATPWTGPATWTPTSVVPTTYFTNMPASRQAQVNASVTASARKTLRGVIGVPARLSATDRGGRARNRSGWSREHGGGEAGEETEPVGAGTGELLDGVLGVGHQADHVAALVGDAGDVVERAVGIDLEVAGDDLPLPLDPGQRVGVGDEAALAVLEGDRDLRALLVGQRPGGAVVLDPQLLVSADELAVVVADQRAGQQVGLAEDLEAVADAEHRQPVVRGTHHLRHHRREARDRAAAEVVAVREPT